MSALQSVRTDKWKRHFIPPLNGESYTISTAAIRMKQRDMRKKCFPGDPTGRFVAPSDFNEPRYKIRISARYDSIIQNTFVLFRLVTVLVLLGFGLTSSQKSVTATLDPIFRGLMTVLLLAMKTMLKSQSK